MNYINITKNDIANGPGVRVVLWVSGCRLHCKNCHNESTWDFNCGKPFTDDTIEEIIEAVNKPWVTGLTLSGGHPLEPENLSGICRLLYYFKQKCPDKTLWLYTGYTLTIDNFKLVRMEDDSSCEHNTMCAILNTCDYVVDGPYIDAQRDLTLLFRGSKNQRIIDVKQSVRNNMIVEYTED